VPPASHVPPSWFRTTSTACSTLPAAGLLHPATDPGVHPRFSQDASPYRPGHRSDPTETWTRARNPRGAVRTLQRVSLASSRTASLRPLPSCRWLPLEGVTPPATPVAECLSQRRLETRSTPRLCSTDESVAPHHRFRRWTPVPSMGFDPLRGPTWSAPHDPAVAVAPPAEADRAAWPPGHSELLSGSAAESLWAFPFHCESLPRERRAAVGVARSLSGPERLRGVRAALTSVGFSTSKIAPRSASSVGYRD